MQSTATFESNSQREGTPGYPGWRVVLAAHLGTMVSFGSLFVFTFGIFLKPLAAEFGWGREEISRGFAIAAMTVAAVSPFLGYALDRWGPRPVVLPCFVLFGAGILGLSRLSGSLAQFYGICFLIGLAGNGTTQMGYSGAVSSWFVARRGMALACVLAGVGIGSIVHPVLAERMTEWYGWRTAYLILGGLVLAGGIPASSLWLRQRPAAEAVRGGSGKSVGAALRQREFWILVAVLFLSSISVNGTLTHLAAHLSDQGITPAGAAMATGILGGANLLGRFLTGWMLDRVFGPRLSMWLLAAMAAGFLLLASTSSLVPAIVASVLIGVGLGGEADVTPYLLTRYFGLESFSKLYGLTWTFYAIAGGTGPVIFGRVFDSSGSYVVVLAVAAGLTMVSALLMLSMRRYPAR